MANGILGQIANPQTPNILGNLAQMQQFQTQKFALDRAKEQAARQDQARQLAGEILGRTATGQLADLARLDPRQYADIANSLGIPLDQPGRVKNVFGIAQMADIVNRTVGPEAALKFVDIEKAKLGAFGIQTPVIDSMMAKFATNPQEATQELAMFVQSGKEAGILGSGRAKPPHVQSSTTMDDGTVIQVMSTGATRVLDAAGRELQGEARAEKIKEAQEFGIEVAMRTKGAEKAAERSVIQGEKAFEAIKPLESSISNIERAIQLVRDEGAGTGIIEARLPSIRSASIELDDLQKRMGLDVVANTTFGALSGPELKLALSVGLPTTLDGPQLIEYLERKRNAQLKLLNYMQEAATFLSQGKGIAAFMKQQKARQERDAANQKALPDEEAPAVPAQTQAQTVQPAQPAPAAPPAEPQIRLRRVRRGGE